ncbi:MAG TPA: hypothetical protein VJ597_07605 [Sphingomicrobium sp.]|nr:hypothetical protein [Sphingomicrobium sp.]
MKTKLLIAVSALALALAPLAAPAVAQHQHMPGMQMPAPEQKPEPEQAKPKAQEPNDTLPTVEPDHPAAHPTNHSQRDHAAHVGMTGAFGPYPMERESSGTAWQPDTSEHSAVHAVSNDWTLMTHGVLNLVYNHQSGRRGDDKVFASGMLMGMARRPIGDGTLQFKAMVSPDPLMGKRGYPLLLASGETANGRDRLIDRQHPHDFFMELSGSVSQNIAPESSVYLYAGLPGEPAFGPPAFMHREAIMDSPEAPISHHWLDSTHIAFGVLTGGIVLDRVRLEVSRFNGREPDQHRWNIETAPLDSTAVRLSWNPTAELSLQASWGHFEDPEQLEPGVDQRRWSASLLYAREIAPGWKLAGTLAWGRKSIKDHHGDRLHDDAYVAEASIKHRGWTIFGRGEITENRELVELEEGEHGPAFRVGKVSLGAVRDFKLAEHWSLGVGGLVALNFVPDRLAPLYGGHNPVGAMGFARLKLD